MADFHDSIREAILVAHSHGIDDQDEKLGTRLWASVGLNVLITCAEFVGGFVSGSVALLADAVHNLSDVFALVLAAFARTLGMRPPSLRHTYGLKRFEVLSALVNAVVLLVITTLLMRESITRLLHPTPTRASITLIIATFALVGNLGSVLLLRRHDEHDLNVRSAFLHLVQDALSSLVVVIAAAFAHTRIGPYLDPAAAVLVGVAVVMSVFSILRETLHTLLEGTPHDIDVEDLVHGVEEQFRPVRLHHVHVWQIGPGQRALTAHFDAGNLEFAAIELLGGEIRHFLLDRWAIQHVTLQPEVRGCGHTEVLGHWGAHP
jgi:cobalt-zinc-cadmium efflux system protein